MTVWRENCASRFEASKSSKWCGQQLAGAQCVLEVILVNIGSLTKTVRTYTIIWCRASYTTDIYYSFPTEDFNRVLNPILAIGIKKSQHWGNLRIHSLGCGRVATVSVASKKIHWDVLIKSWAILSKQLRSWNTTKSEKATHHEEIELFDVSCQQILEFGSPLHIKEDIFHLDGSSKREREVSNLPILFQT
jgi:hypothetical protein